MRRRNGIRELSPRKRARLWRAVARAKSKVVVGARSALFLPYPDLGLIIVDEEHEPAYKQEEGVHYHARDMAVVRGHIARHPGGLSSATPSLETDVNARRGRKKRLRCLNATAGGNADRRVDRSAPRADCRAEFRRPPLLDAVKKRIGAASRRCCFSTAAATRR